MSEHVDDVWFDEAVRLNEIGESARALDVVYGHIDDWLLAGKFAECEAFMRRLDVEHIAPRLVLAVVILSHPARHRIGYCEKFLDLAWKNFAAHGQDAHRLLWRFQKDHKLIRRSVNSGVAIGAKQQ